MNLLECEPKVWFEIEVACDDVKFWELGLIPGQRIRKLKSQGGLVILELYTSSIFAIRDEKAKCVKLRQWKNTNIETKK